MRVAFYKAKGNWQDWLVRIFSGKYSHVEVIIDDIWYSASKRDKGIRSKVIKAKEGHWDYVDIPSIPSQDVKALEIFSQLAGTKYYILTGFFGGINCVELAKKMISTALFVNSPHIITPDDLKDAL